MQAPFPGAPARSDVRPHQSKQALVHIELAIKSRKDESAIPRLIFRRRELAARRFAVNTQIEDRQ